ncbi:MAG: hydrolase TatD [Planctomyces sp.]|jgi:TatD DNase family protein|nr:hydrolase TatD [Planctomyces sp.]
MHELFDTHCHLDEDAFAHERDDVIQRAVACGVTRMLSIGTTLASSLRAVELAKVNPHVRAIVGIHPNYCVTAAEDDWAAICELARDEHVLGVGETGLDRYWDHTPIEQQLDYFRRHIELSWQVSKPFVVHCRDAEPETLALLEEMSRIQPLNGAMHSFAGSAETAAKCLELGLLLSFSGMITYKRNEALLNVARSAPLDRIMIETDAPYLAPVPMRGKRNEPAHVRYTLGVLADARQISREDLAATTTTNAIAFFQWPTAKAV